MVRCDNCGSSSLEREGLQQVNNCATGECRETTIWRCMRCTKITVSVVSNERTHDKTDRT